MAKRKPSPAITARILETDGGRHDAVHVVAYVDCAHVSEASDEEPAPARCANVSAVCMTIGLFRNCEGTRL